MVDNKLYGNSVHEMDACSRITEESLVEKVRCEWELGG